MNIHPLPYQKGRRRDEEKIKRNIYIYIYIDTHTGLGWILGSLNSYFVFLDQLIKLEWV
jgi:hypothetical protein